jgi:hypothetical protein
LRLAGYHRKSNKVLDALAQDAYIAGYPYRKIYVHALIGARGGTCKGAQVSIGENRAACHSANGERVEAQRAAENRSMRRGLFCHVR